MADGHALPIGPVLSGDKSAPVCVVAGEHSCLITVLMRKRVQSQSSTGTPQRFGGAERTRS